MSEEYFVLHECKFTDDKKRQIVFSKDANNGFENAWNLYIRRVANEKDLEENHYFESEGDIVWEATIEIIYCPFCGTKLEGAREFKGEASLFEAVSSWYGAHV